MTSPRASGLAALREELRARGYFEKATGRVLGELALMLAIALLGLAGCLASHGVVLNTAALVVLTLGTLGVTTNTHTSSHYATSRHGRLNEFLTFFGYPFLVGFSATYWWHKHVVRHHPNPNVIGMDGDIDLQPFFALTTGERDSPSRLRRAYYRVQWLVIPFAIVLNSFNLEVAGWRYLLGALRDPARRRAAHWVDLGALLLQWLLWIVVPMFVFLPAHVWLFYVARRGLISYAFFAVFAPSHFPAEAVFVDAASADADPVLLQTATSVNFRAGVVGRLLCAGLNYQIEHHLFPGMSHVYYARASRLVEAYCRAHGYPYRTLGWGEAVLKSLKTFYRPKPVHRLATASSARALVS